ncbi:MAG: hypothetical protein EXS10_02995 [Phycisphaerales bacterium]|nr:hypothetical protein [Phycisphaerales bacterium]
MDFGTESLGNTQAGADRARSADRLIELTPARVTGFRTRTQVSTDPSSRPIGRVRRELSAAPGSFVWHDLYSSNAAESGAFLRNMFGWYSKTLGRRTLLTHGALHVAGVVAVSTDPQLHPGTWRPHLRVANVDDCVTRARALGGRIVKAAAGIPGLDRHAEIVDPMGASLVVADGTLDRRTVGESTISWDELHTQDPRVSATFWTSLFGWTTEWIVTGREPIGLFLNGGARVASFRHTSNTLFDRANRWVPFIQVPLAPSACAIATGLGAVVTSRLVFDPLLGDAAILRDPGGAEIGICEARGMS